MDEGRRLTSLCVTTPHSCVYNVKCTLCNTLLLGWTALLMLHRTEVFIAQLGSGEGQVLIGCRRSGAACQKTPQKPNVGIFCRTAGSPKKIMFFIHFFKGVIFHHSSLSLFQGLWVAKATHLSTYNRWNVSIVYVPHALHINDNWKDEASEWLGTGAFWRH